MRFQLAAGAEYYSRMLRMYGQRGGGIGMVIGHVDVKFVSWVQRCNDGPTTRPKYVARDLQPAHSFGKRCIWRALHAAGAMECV